MEEKKKKNPTYKNQGQEPIHQKYKANESKSRHNPSKNKKNSKKKKKPMQIGPMAIK